jgi:hypothetical protein
MPHVEFRPEAVTISSTFTKQFATEMYDYEIYRAGYNLYQTCFILKFLGRSKWWISIGILHNKEFSDLYE